MKTEASRQIYNRRPHMAVTAFNLKKLVRELGRMRAEFAELIAATEGQER